MHLSSPELEEITSLLEQSATESQENENLVPFIPEKKLNQPVPLTDIPKVRCVCVRACVRACVCVFQLNHWCSSLIVDC